MEIRQCELLVSTEDGAADRPEVSAPKTARPGLGGREWFPGGGGWAAALADWIDRPQQVAKLVGSVEASEPVAGHGEDRFVDLANVAEERGAFGH